MWPSALGKASKVLEKANIAQTAMAYCNMVPSATSLRAFGSEYGEEEGIRTDLWAIA